MTRASAFARAAGGNRILAGIALERAAVFGSMNRVVEADATLREGIAAARVMGERLLLPRLLARLADVRLSRGRLGDAATLLEEADDIVEGLLTRASSPWVRSRIIAGMDDVLVTRIRLEGQRSQGNPIYQMDNPMDVTALMMVAVAKADGDMTAEEKHKILDMFREEFALSKRDASDLMVASVYLLRDGSELRTNVGKVMARCIDKFTREQALSASTMISNVAAIDGRPNEIKGELVRTILSCLEPVTGEKQSRWK